MSRLQLLPATITCPWFLMADALMIPGHTPAPPMLLLVEPATRGCGPIVWGGIGCSYGNCYLNTGGRYNPSTDTWTATGTTNAPIGRDFHTAVWTGSEMIVWGGEGDNFISLNTGGRYNPGTNSWTATSTTNAPVARQDHTAVWTGAEMIVWGGFGAGRIGGRYN